MSTHYTLHCEVLKNGSWENWDLYRFKGINNYEVIPVLQGKSFLGSALRWYGLLDKRIDYEEVSDRTTNAHITHLPEYQDWRVFDYREFYKDKNFLLYEHCGYFARDVLNQFKTENDYEILKAAMETASFLSPGEFAKITPEAQRGFEYFEFTVPGGIHDTMRRIQDAVEIRLFHSDELIDGPVRIVILIE